MRRFILGGLAACAALAAVANIVVRGPSVVTAPLAEAAYVASSPNPVATARAVVTAPIFFRVDGRDFPLPYSPLSLSLGSLANSVSFCFMLLGTLSYRTRWADATAKLKRQAVGAKPDEPDVGFNRLIKRVHQVLQSGTVAT